MVDAARPVWKEQAGRMTPYHKKVGHRPFVSSWGPRGRGGSGNVTGREATPNTLNGSGTYEVPHYLSRRWYGT